MTQFTISDLSSIRETAREFIDVMNGRTIFAFNGSMGAGKTTFIKAICEELDVQDVINSPTFAIVNEYHSSVLNDMIYHFDFYRINSPEEALNIGVEDYFDSGCLCFIEWSERIETLLPAHVVTVSITEQPDKTRLITMN